MRRSFAVRLAIVFALASAGVARADVIFPPPAGKKFVAVEHKFVTDKDYPEFAFFTIIGDKATPVEFTTKKPVVIAAKDIPRRAERVALVAVPKDAAKDFKSEDAFLKAVAKEKVAGLVATKGNFWPQATVSEKVAEDSIVSEHKVEKIDAKDGIVVPAPKKECGETGADDAEPAAVAPVGGRLWVAGLAGFAAFASAGLWLTRRRGVSPPA